MASLGKVDGVAPVRNSSSFDEFSAKNCAQ